MGLGWPLDEIASGLDEVASVAVDVATGDWQGAAATVTDQVGEWTGIEELEQVAAVVQTASWSNIATAAAGKLGEAVGGDLGAAITQAGSLAGAAAAGDWGAVVNAGVQVLGDDLPPQVAQLAGAAATGGWDGAVDWAQNNAVQLGTQLAGEAFGADAANLASQIATTYATGGTDALLQMGAQTLDGVVPGAGTVASQVLAGASPDDVMEGLLDAGKAQVLTVGQQVITATGLGDDVANVMAALDPVTDRPAAGTAAADGVDEAVGVMTAAAPGAPAGVDVGVGDDLGAPDLVGVAATNTASVPGDAFDDTSGLDDTAPDGAPDEVMAQVDAIEPEVELPASLAQADQVGDQAMTEVDDMFDNLT